MEKVKKSSKYLTAPFVLRYCIHALSILERMAQMHSVPCFASGLCAFHCLVSFLNFVHLDTVVLHDTGVHLTTVGGFNLQEDASWRLLRSSAAAATTLLAEFGRELRSKIAKLQEGEMSTLSAILHYDSSRFPLLTQFSTKELQLSATSECSPVWNELRTPLRSTMQLRGDSRSCIVFKIMQGTHRFSDIVLKCMGLYFCPQCRASSVKSFSGFSASRCRKVFCLWI